MSFRMKGDQGGNAKISDSACQSASPLFREAWNIPARFSQGPNNTAVTPKPQKLQWVAFIRLLVVIAGCWWVSGTGSSTVSAHSSDRPGFAVTHDRCIQDPYVQHQTHDPVRYGFFLRTPIAFPKRRRLIIVVYARYSTEEQHPSSIPDQISYCKKLLVEFGINLDEVTIITFSDEGISGEIVSRPGIDQVKELVEAGECGLLIAEDSSRLYRNETACGQLIETAVDADIRVLCPNDDLDTNEEDWEERLHQAQRHHSQSNRYTRLRIHRKLDGLWEMGAAIGSLRPGYKRNSTVPASTGQKAVGPHFDEIDPDWEPIVYKTFERVAGNEELWLVAQWLTEEGLPKCANAITDEWTDKNVISLIRCMKYRGLEQRKVTVAKKKYRTGKTKQVRNASEDIQTRKMEHYRIVPDWLWNKANANIDNNRTQPNPPTGVEHPLFDIPRDSRGPLSQVFYCGICRDGKMHAEGRNEGGYRCCKALKGKCWNKATTLREPAHKKIGQAVGTVFLEECETMQVVVDQIRTSLQKDECFKAEDQELAKMERELERKKQRLLDHIEDDDDPPKDLKERLQQRESELEKVQTRREELKYKRDRPRQLPNNEEIERQMHEKAGQLLDLDREAGALLKRLVVGKILAVPYQQFGSNKVVLRTEFEIRLANILLDDLQLSLAGKKFEGQIDSLMTRKIVVDLFPPSVVPANALRALELYEGYPKLTYVKVGEKLGISKRQTILAVKLGREMREAGIVDPYIRLTECPENASRWRSKKKHRRKDNDDGSTAA